jgi:hypothetical protein
MTTIKGVDFDAVVRDAVEASKEVADASWDQARDIIENIANGLVNDVSFIAKKQLSGEFDEEDARVYLEDQKTLARMRLRSLAIITLKIAERIWNAIAKVFQGAINQALGWTLL